VFLLALALPAWFVERIGKEMWYDIFEGISYLLLSVIVLHIASSLCGSVGLISSTYRRQGIAVMLTAGIIALSWSAGWINNPFGGRNMRWQGMRVPETGAVPYVKDSDIESVQQFLRLRGHARPQITVQCIPGADAFFFSRDPSFRFINLRFCEMTPDIYIAHISRWLPRRWRKVMRAAWREKCADAGARILLQRDGTEEWYAYERLP